MILPNYNAFRHWFADKITTSATCTFTDADPDTIARAAGSFITDGYEAGMVVEPNGTADNNARYTIATVAASTLTLVAGDAVTTEASVACGLTAFWEATDGWPEFPGPFTNGTNLVGASSIPALVFEPRAFGQYGYTIDGGGPDSVPGTDEYDWYLSQPTADAASQWLTIAQRAGSSSVVDIDISALGLSELGIGLPNPLTTAQIIAVLRNCHLCVKRRSDSAIQWVDMLANVTELLDAGAVF